MTYPTNTPWGKPDTIFVVAPGIVEYSTPSHGGYWLSHERISSMPEGARKFVPFAGRGWFEEDCDWSIVVASFPREFTPELVDAAMSAVEGWHKDQISDPAGTFPEAHAIALAQRARRHVAA